MAIKSNLFQHQAAAVRRFAASTSGALLFEPGLGKTLTALALVDSRIYVTPTYKTLIICPATLIENWAAEIVKHTDRTFSLLTGSRKRRLQNLETSVNYYIINYEGARIITDDLIRKQFNCVICDESQALKDANTLQSKACFRISQSIPHRIIMTGTPIMNTPLDVFGQYRVLDPFLFGNSYYRFRAMYAVMGGFMGKQVVHYINLPRLKQKVLSLGDLRTKEECLDLPPKLYEVVCLDLPEEQNGMYKGLREQFIAEFNNSIVTAPIILTRLTRFSQITAGFYKDIGGIEHAFEKNPKQDWVVTWLKEQGKKTVIFCRFRKEIELLESRLTKENISFVSLHGGTGHRLDVINKFNDSNSGVQVFIGQIDTAGQGINLTSSSYVIFLTNNYSYGDRVQAEDRIHRIGQHNNCTYIDIVYRNTVDQHVLKALEKKQSLARMLGKDLLRMV